MGVNLMSETIPTVVTYATDPREMTPEDLNRLGFKRVSRGQAIRDMCLSCMGGSPAEVRRCENGACPLFVFRMNHDPYREQREMTEEQRAAGAERLRKARESRTGAQPQPASVSLFDDD
jgi:hypothetical protein